eukprot:31008-Pelagococcus_subviridis.AAC.7
MLTSRVSARAATPSSASHFPPTVRSDTPTRTARIDTLRSPRPRPCASARRRDRRSEAPSPALRAPRSP